MILTKSLIVKTFAFLVLLGSLFGVVYYFFNTQTVVFTYKNCNRLDITKGDDVIASITENNASLRLGSNEKYTAQCAPLKGYATTKKPFITTSNLTKVDISPYYSKDRLSNILSRERRAIYAALNSRYANFFDLYENKNERLYRFGSWYGGFFAYKTDDANVGDSIFMILKKDGTVWDIKSEPSIILTQYNTPDAPLDILKQTNELSF